jgi:hypothetical protein
MSEELKAMRNLSPKRLTGRCVDGGELDGGSLYHAVSRDEGNMGKAVCGAKPGRRSNGWSLNDGEQVTCKRCVVKL